jgi:hypothetical protein
MTKGKKINCIDCGFPFIFSEPEQRYFTDRGLAEPKRCVSCRRARKARLNNMGYQNHNEYGMTQTEKPELNVVT